MKTPFRFFLSEQTNGITLTTLLLLSACSSTPVRENAEDQLLKSRQVQKIYRGALFDAYFHDQTVLHAVETAKTDPSEAVLKTYCEGSRQVRDLSFLIKIVPPSPPKGIPVDRAAKIAANATSQLRWVARNAFRTFERPAVDPKDPDLAFERDYVTVGGGGVDGLIKKAGLIPASDEIRYDRVAEDGPKLEYVFIGLGGSTIILVDRQVLPEERLRYGSYSVESEQSLRNRPMQVDLARALPGEWAFLSQLVLLPPKNEFKAWAAYRDRLQDADPSEAYIGPEHADNLYDHNGRIVIEEAMSKAEEVWSIYVLRYASSKTATQQDGSTVVEVSLDLGGICSYARSRRMLLSK